MPKHATSYSVQELVTFNELAKNFPDYPEGFVPPLLRDPSYVAPFKGTGLIVSAIVTTVLVLIVVPLRLAIRAGPKAKFWGWDDTLIIPATVLALIINALDIYVVLVGGLGYHSYDLNLSQLVLAYRLQFVHTQLYFWATLMTKLSILCFYVRMQPSRATRTSRFIILFMIFLPCLTLVSTFLVVFKYRPVQAAWDLNAFTGTVDGAPLPYTLFWLSLVYTICDFIVWVIPIPMVLRLRVDLKRRIGLLVLFGVGLAVCVIVSIRTAIVRHDLLTFDGTWAGTDVLLCNQLEACLGLLVASLPAVNARTAAAIFGCWSRVSSITKSSLARYSSRPKKSSTTPEKSERTDFETDKTDKAYTDTHTTSLYPRHISVDREFVLSEETHNEPPTPPKKSRLPHNWLDRNIIDFSHTRFTRDSYRLSGTPSGLGAGTSSEESLQLTIQGPRHGEAPSQKHP